MRTRFLSTRPAASLAHKSAPKLAVSTRGLKLSLGHGQQRREILRGIDLDLPRGKLHFLVGPNGCGKSTLLRVLGRLLTPDEGVVYADNPIGFVFQNPDHQVVMPTVAADVAFNLGTKDIPEDIVRGVVKEALRSVGLEEYFESSLSLLSGGQKQRVAIAGALVGQPKLLLLDELTTFVDYEDQERVIRCVRDIVEERGVTAVWVTHRFEELNYADTATYMDDGQIACQGSAKDIENYLIGLGAVL